MMSEMLNLAGSVADALVRAESQAAPVAFSPAALDAMRLADIFSDVNPQEHFLPIDAMAGFPVSVTARRLGSD